MWNPEGARYLFVFSSVSKTQLLQKFQEEGDIILNSITLDDFPSIDDIVYSSLGRLISFSENDCGYMGSSHNVVM